MGLSQGILTGALAACEMQSYMSERKNKPVLGQDTRCGPADGSDQMFPHKSSAKHSGIVGRKYGDAR